MGLQNANHLRKDKNSCLLDSEEDFSKDEAYQSGDDESDDDFDNEPSPEELEQARANGDMIIEPEEAAEESENSASDVDDEEEDSEAVEISEEAAESFDFDDGNVSSDGNHTQSLTDE